MTVVQVDTRMPTPDDVTASLAPSPTALRPPVEATHADLLIRQLSGRWADEPSVLGEMCRHAFLAPGKLFRPTLLLESAQAVGGAAHQVLPAALGTESGHVASLVHDDIIDDDAMRRGQPAVQAKFGTGNAIVAGDALIFDLFLSLARCRGTGAADTAIVSALEVVSRSGIDLCRGQSLEYEITCAGSRDLAMYVEMIRLKTGALFSGACRAGALLGGGTDAHVETLGRYGDELGIAFQMCDDLLTYIGGTDDAIGKSLLSDIRNRRMTLPILVAYDGAGPLVGQQLDAALDAAMSPERALPLIVDALQRSDAILRSRVLAARHADAAIAALGLLPAGESRDRLATFARLAVERVR
ncbi:MAG: polyprenyl synthetase family protein [Jatrophihabitans sp.]